MVEVVAERGYAGASLDLVVAQAGVSRRTFYRCFENRDACFRELLDLAWASALELVATAFAREPTWQDGVRSALVSLLVFLDSEPSLARVWLVESLAAGSWVLEHRERNLAAMRALVAARWPAAGTWSASPLVVEGAMASVLGVVQTHIVAGKPGLLVGLLGPLTGLVFTHYLPPHLVASEIERGDELARVSRAGLWKTVRGNAAMPAVLGNPNAHRARRCILFLADSPHASNREIAAAIGVAHESQISKLLSRLLKERMVAKHSNGAGKRNLWRLTARGEEISCTLRGATDGQIKSDRCGSNLWYGTCDTHVPDVAPSGLTRQHDD